MAQSHDTMMKPGIEGLLERGGSKFSLVTLAARRARNINSYFNQLGDGLGHMIPPQVSSTARKPLSIAFEEISVGKIVKTDLPVESADADVRRRRAGRRRELTLRVAMLAGKRIVLGVTGGIAAYKAVEISRRLVDAGAHVVPVMTKGAEHFLGATTLSALASEPVRTRLWDDPDTPIPHTKIGQGADLVLVAPATARIVAAYRMGLSTDLLTNVLLATRAPVMICPAMHTEMWEHPAVVDNIAVLRARGRARGRTRVRPARRWRRRRRPPRSTRVDRRRGRAALHAPRPRRAEGRRQRRWHPRADRRGARHRQPQLRQAGLRDRRGGRRSRRHGHAGQHGRACRTGRRRGRPRRDRGADAGGDGAHRTGVRRGRDGGRGRRLPPRAGRPRARSRSTRASRRSCSSRRPTSSPASARASRSGRCSWASPPRPTISRRTPIGKLERKHLDLIVANDVSAPATGFQHDTNAVTLFARGEPPVILPLADKRTIAAGVLDRVVALRNRAR